jgi:hypothetical protein
LKNIEKWFEYLDKNGKNRKLRKLGGRWIRFNGKKNSIEQKGLAPTNPTHRISEFFAGNGLSFYTHILDGRTQLVFDHIIFSL